MSVLLTIKSRSHDYVVESRASFGEIVAELAADKSRFFLLDEKVAKLYGMDASLQGARVMTLEASEGMKSYERLAPVFSWLIESGCKRGSVLAVFGGGVVQDIGCFVASVLYRGISWELVPTTLLAQCDSCIGSKSSLNIGKYKNQLGTFYPPHRVLLTHDVLKTLSRDEIHSGLGEIIKLHLLDGVPATEALKHALAELDRDPAALSGLVLSALKIKQRFIEVDEFDRGVRNLLNYGHTFAHAYESSTSYGIPHGIAVSLGMLTATYVSEKIGMTGRGHYEDVKALLMPYCRPYHQVLAKADQESILAGMMKDKKNTDARITCILTRGPGRMEKVPLPAQDVRERLNAFLQELV